MNSLSVIIIQADSVHLLSYGESSLRAFEQLLERVRLLCNYFAIEMLRDNNYLLGETFFNSG